jgi:hypothetical protein
VYAGAGLSFSKCHAEYVVPYDSQLDHVFDGEEYSRALRLFTCDLANVVCLLVKRVCVCVLC